MNNPLHRIRFTLCANHFAPMLSIQRSQVPPYLQASGFYLSLNENEEETLSVPQNSFKLNTTITNHLELTNLLSTLRFWIVDTIPDDLIEVSLDTSCVYFEEVCIEFQNELIFLPKLRELRRAESEDRPKLAAQFGYVEVLKHLVQHKYHLTVHVATAACQAGHLACLQYLHSVGSPWTSENCGVAARHGHASCLRFCLEHSRRVKGGSLVLLAVQSNSLLCVQIAVEHGGALGSVCLQHAAQQGNLPILKYIHSQGIEWDSCEVDLAELLAQLGHLDCLTYALQHECEAPPNILDHARTLPCLEYLYSAGYTWTEHSSAEVARSGLRMLQFAYEHGCPWSTQSDTFVAILDHFYSSQYTNSTDSTNTANRIEASSVDSVKLVEFIQYAHERGCAWTDVSLKYAVQCGDLSAVQYMHTHGCALSGVTLDTAMAYKHAHLVEYLVTQECPASQKTMHTAAYAASLEMIKYAHSKGCAFDEATLCKCVVGTPYTLSRMECLRYIHQHGGLLTENVFLTTLNLTTDENLELLKYLMAHKCPIGTSVVRSVYTLQRLRYLYNLGYTFTTHDFAQAAQRGLTYVQYLHSVGCPYDASACSASVYHGTDMEVLVYLHTELHCPWNASTLLQAVRVYNLPALRYAHEHGCPWSSEVRAATEFCVDPDIVAYVQRHSTNTTAAPCRCVIQ